MIHAFILALKFSFKEQQKSCQIILEGTMSSEIGACVSLLIIFFTLFHEYQIMSQVLCGMNFFLFNYTICHWLLLLFWLVKLPKKGLSNSNTSTYNMELGIVNREPEYNNKNIILLENFIYV